MSRADAQRALGLAIGFICTSLFWIAFILYLNRLHHKKKAEVEDLESKMEEKDSCIEDKIAEVMRANERVDGKQRDINLYSQTISELRDQLASFEADAADREDALRHDSEQTHQQEMESIRQDLNRSAERERDMSGQFANLKRAATLVRSRFDRTNQEFSTALEQLADTERKAERLEGEILTLRGIDQAESTSGDTGEIVSHPPSSEIET